jgi:hypothetical protein
LCRANSDYILRMRTGIPPLTAAKALFASDRTCCVCRTPGKPVQIHHIDEDPSNHALENLAVLCLDHHRDTQLRGGFDRKLDADQVILYRDDWNDRVARNRVSDRKLQEELEISRGSPDLALETSIAEVHRENGQYELLAIHYDRIGNEQLRDKYIELAIKRGISPAGEVFMRSLQGKVELVSSDSLDDERKQLEESNDWSQLARFYVKTKDTTNAVRYYCKSILESLDERNIFSAGYYLKELSQESLFKQLFEKRMNKAAKLMNFGGASVLYKNSNGTQSLDRYYLRTKEKSDRLETFCSLSCLNAPLAIQKAIVKHA